MLVEPPIMATSGGGSLRLYSWFGRGDLGMLGGDELAIDANEWSTKGLIGCVGRSECGYEKFEYCLPYIFSKHIALNSS